MVAKWMQVFVFGRTNFGCRKCAQLDNRYKNRTKIVLQQKLVDFDNTTIVLQPANVVALFLPRAKDAVEAVEDDDAAADKGPANTATKQTFESEDAANTATKKQTFENEEDAAADEDTAKTFESKDAAADEDAANTATKQTFESADAAADEDTAKQTFGSADAADTAADEDAANTAIKQTFRSMGLRCEKSVATHLLLENAYQSNLLSDISKVDYLEGNLGSTNLRPLEGLPAFIDDIFVFGYVSREECVFQRGKLHCTSGEKGVAKLVVASIANALERALRKRGYMQTSVVHAVAVGEAATSTIRATIARIEKDTLYKAKGKWKEIHPKKEIAGYFVAKCFRNPSGGYPQQSACFRKVSGGLWLRNLQHRLHTGFFRSSRPRSACGPPWFSKGGGFLHYNRRRTADDSRKHKNRREARLHLDIDTQGRAHSTHKNIQQSRVEFRGRRNPQTCWWPSGRLRRLPQPAPPPNLPTPERASPRVHTHRSLSVRAPLYELSSKKATDYIGKVLEQVSTEDEEDGVFVVQPPSKQ